MASWPFILTWRIRFNVAATPVASTAYLIVFGAFNNVLVVPNNLDASRLDLLAQIASWPGFSTRCGCCVVAQLPVVLVASVVILELAWCSRFAARLVWLVWSTPR